MFYIKKAPFLLIPFYTFPVYAIDVGDFDSFYSAYKTYASENNINITSDLTATRLLSAAGAENTIINGGGYNFNGANYNGFTVSSGYTINVTDAGKFTINDDNSVNLESSVSDFYQTGQGAVFANLGGTVNIQNSAFSNNSSRYGGSVVYQNNFGSLNISNSAFLNNSVTRSNGGVIYNQYRTTAVIDGSFFQGNSASQYGGVIFNDGDVSVSNSVFNSNTAYSGAAIYNSSNLNISNSLFINNNGSQDVGAVYTTGMMEVSDSVFSNNTGITGGAIGNYGIIGDGLFSVVKSSSFTGNTGTYGGAVYNWDDMYIIDSSFYDNSSTDGGGAIFNLNAMFLIAQNKDMVFTGNTSAGVSNAVYTTEILHLNAENGYQIAFNDRITGSGSVVINRPYELESSIMPSDGKILLNEDMTGFSGDVFIDGGEVEVTDTGKFFAAENLTVSGGMLNLGLTNASVGTATFSDGAILGLRVQDENTYGYLTADSFNISNEALLNVVLDSAAMSGKDTIRLQLLRSTQEISDNFLPDIDNNLYVFIKLGNGWYEVEQQITFLDVIKSAGGNQNNENTAIAWQNSSSEDSETSSEVYEKLDELVQLDAHAYIRALTALAPSSAPIMQILGTSYAERFNNLLSLSIEEREEFDIGKTKVWASAIGTGGRLEEDSFYANFDMYGYGAAVGLEYDFYDFDIGVAYTYQYDRLKSWARTMHAPTNGIGLYARYIKDNFIWNNTASIFYTDLNETKNVAGIQVFDDMQLYTTSIWSDIGYNFSFYDWNMLPVVGARYMFMNRRSSTDTAGQEISSADLNFFTSYAKVSFQNDFWIGKDFVVAPVIEFGGSYDWRADIDELNVKLNLSEYYIQAERLVSWQANAGLKLKMTWNDIYEIQIGADAAIRKGYNNYSGNIKGTIRF